MIRLIVRGAAILLLAGLAGVSWLLQEIQFVLAGVAVLGLVELALALRARRGRAQARRDRSRLDAAQVSCTEQDGALTVALVGEAEGRDAPPYVLLARRLRTQGQPQPPGDPLPYLELSDPKCSVHGGIQDAYLSPRLLRLTLDARAAETLGAPEVCVTLQAAADQRRLERALGRILRGVAFTSERSLPEEADESPAAMAG